MTAATAFWDRSCSCTLIRILSDRPGAVSQMQVIDTPQVRAASDHLPLAARVGRSPPSFAAARLNFADAASCEQLLLVREIYSPCSRRLV